MKTTKPVYHGWIYVEKNPGMKDYFTVEYVEKGKRVTRNFEHSAGAAVEFFDARVGKPVSLLKTPLGLRVYTEEPV